jgi:hypothetical protein
MAYGTDPLRDHDDGDLRVLGSTGEPWKSRVVVVVLQQRGRRPPAARQLQRRDRSKRRHLSRATFDAHQTTSFGGPSWARAADVIDAAGN